MWEVEKKFKVMLGGNISINTPNLVVYKGEPLFVLRRHDETGYLGIDFKIYDAHGKHVASVRRNEIYIGDRAAYEIQGSTDQYKLSEKASGRELCNIKKRAAAMPAELEVSVHLYTPDGFLFEATPTRTNIAGNMFAGCVIEDCAVGIAIG